MTLHHAPSRALLSLCALCLLAACAPLAPTAPATTPASPSAAPPTPPAAAASPTPAPASSASADNAKDIPPAYQTPLLLAAHRNQVAELRRLWLAATPADLADPLGRSPLHAAASAGAQDAASFLLDQGAPVDARDHQGATALMYAISQQHPGLAQWLLQRGANPNARTSAGFVPLDFAANHRDYATLSALITAGATLQTASGQPFLTDWLDWSSAAAAASLHGQKRVFSEPQELQLLQQLAQRPDWARQVNAPNSRRETALMVAAEAAPPSVVQFLLAHGANKTLRDANHLSAADWALLGNRSDIYCLLQTAPGPNPPSGLIKNGAPLPAKAKPTCR